MVLSNVQYDNLASLIVMVMFGSAAVCLLTTDSLQYCLIVTSCGLTAGYCIKRRYTLYLSPLVPSTQNEGLISSQGLRIMRYFTIYHKQVYSVSSDPL